MVSIISQFYLADYALQLDKNNNHKEIINLVLSNMPIDLQRKFLEDIKQWIIVADIEDSYWDKYVEPLSKWFDDALAQAAKFPIKERTTAMTEICSQTNNDIAGMTLDEIEHGISDMSNIKNSYTNSSNKGNLLYTYNINHYGIIEIKVFNDNKQIFKICFAGTDTILHNMYFLETNHVFSFEYEFDKKIFNENENGHVKGDSAYYVSHRGLMYTIDLEDYVKKKPSRKVLKWISEKQFEDEIERKDPNAKHLTKKKN